MTMTNNFCGLDDDDDDDEYSTASALTIDRVQKELPQLLKDDPDLSLTKIDHTEEATLPLLQLSLKEDGMMKGKEEEEDDVFQTTHMPLHESKSSARDPPGIMSYQTESLQQQRLFKFKGSASKSSDKVSSLVHYYEYESNHCTSTSLQLYGSQSDTSKIGSEEVGEESESSAATSSSTEHNNTTHIGKSIPSNNSLKSHGSTSSMSTSVNRSWIPRQLAVKSQLPSQNTINSKAECLKSERRDSDFKRLRSKLQLQQQYDGVELDDIGGVVAEEEETATPNKTNSTASPTVGSVSCSDIDTEPGDQSPAISSSQMSCHQRTFSRKSTTTTLSTLGSVSCSDIGTEPLVQQNISKPKLGMRYYKADESKILIPESHEGKLVTILSNDQLRVLTCRITIDPRDQSKEVEKYKEMYKIDANSQHCNGGIIGKREDMMDITRVESSSSLPKPATELLQTIKRRSTASLSAAPLFTSNVDENEDTDINGCGTEAWLFYSRLCTLFLPDALLCFVGNKDMEAKELRIVKQAWREKIALCMIMASSSLGFLFVCIILPSYILGCGKETTSNIGCTFFDTRIVDYTLCVIIGVVLSVQCCASFILACKKKPIITADVTSSKVFVVMPCYNEGFKELNKTIKSVTDTTYPADNKVFIAIADGQITGRGEPASTPQILGHILGYENDEVESHNTFHKYKSVGTITDNYAQIHYGTTAAKGLKYLVIEKVGTNNERDSPRAGNRGKRDSLVIMMGLLNRIHYGKDLTSLDIAIVDALDYLQVSIDDVEHLLAIDADTRISKMSISYMVAAMKDEDDILALCGETKVDNKTQSWVTGLQVFEYYQSHHMKKAFETMFGCVTCLPGCFTMYRLAAHGQPLLSADYVYNKYSTNKVETLHEKNLFHLGEDRYLTTLLLLKFDDMKLSFVPKATCHTVVPNTFSVLLSQRRRWINSTFHNMIELLHVNTMCGICCLSMRAIIVLDLVSTFILPASLLYFGYLCVRALALVEIPPIMLLATIGLTLLVHIAVFLIRRRWDFWWWLVVYCLGVVPVFYFILPLYSFYHMDDFSWGSTRKVGQSQTLTRQKAVRNLDIDKYDTEMTRYEEIDFTDELELDDELKKIFT